MRGLLVAMLLGLAWVAAVVALTRGGSGDAGADTEAAARRHPPPCLFAFLSRLPGGVEERRLAQVGSRVSVLAPNWYTLTRAGRVRGGPPDTEVVAIARRHRIPLWPVVNGIGPRLSGASARRVAWVARRSRFAGITLDVEGLRPDQRRAYTRWVARVGRLLRRDGRKLAVYGPRRTATRVLRSAAAYDWRALAREADLLLASGYGEHGPGTSPGPPTTRAGFAATLRYASAVSRHRAAPVVGAFGWRWPAGGGKPSLISAAEAETRRLAGLPGGAPGANRWYELGGDTVWYPTAAGLRARMRDVRGAGFRWVALFSLGREPAGVVSGAGVQRCRA